MKKGLCLLLALCLLTSGCVLPDMDTVAKRIARKDRVSPELSFYAHGVDRGGYESVTFIEDSCCIFRGTVLELGEFSAHDRLKFIYYETAVNEYYIVPPGFDKNILSFLAFGPFLEATNPVVGKEYVFFVDLYSEQAMAEKRDKYGDAEFERTRLDKYFDGYSDPIYFFCWPVTEDGIIIRADARRDLGDYRWLAQPVDESIKEEYGVHSKPVMKGIKSNEWLLYPAEVMWEAYVPSVKARMIPRSVS